MLFPPPITGTRRSSSRNGTENTHEVSPNMYIHVQRVHVVGTVLSVCNGEDTVWSLFGLVGSGSGGKKKGMNGRGSMDVRVTRPLPTLNTVSLHPTKESHLRTVILDVIIHIMKELNRDTFVELIVL